MVNKLGFPYHYGDNGPDVLMLSNSKILKIALMACVGIVIIPGRCIAIDEVVAIGGILYRKAALEAARSSACAATGACMVIFTESLKCGNIPTATAALCGAAAYCIDATAKLALAKMI